jgi:SAM-dependent methyltransferase
VSDTGPSDTGATGGLSPEERSLRSASFGAAASLYDRYRRAPPLEAIEWMLGGRRSTVVDLGAGTGALTRLLVDRADRVFAIEPDARMRELLTQNAPSATVLNGRGEAIPLPDASADAVLASSSWHWMDPGRTLFEVHRVLVPGGLLGAVWSGADVDGPFFTQARAFLSALTSDDAPQGGRADAEDLAHAVFDANAPSIGLVLAEDAPFAPTEHEIFAWDVALNADELIGLLGTFSWVILMPEERRARVVAEARRVLRDGFGVEGDVTVNVAYRAEAWRTIRDA